jgi:2-amino-4-hydroxy-6-hydroxymethyldihydropteridine diphosphokinase
MTPERVFVGLGANLGDPQAALHAALAALRQLPDTTTAAVSPFFRSAPIDATGPDFVNAVAELHTQLAPLPLLQALQAIEQQQGRQRPYHHAPRTLDLDLLLYGQQQLHLPATATTPALQLPHPRMHQRAFVLLPLLCLAPQLVHPTLGPLQAFLPQVAHQAVSQMH